MPKQKPIPKQDEKEGTQIISESTSLHIGPIPDAKTLKEYKDISLDFPERIFKMAENEQKSRIDNDKKIVDRGTLGDLFGRFFAFIITCMFIVISYILIRDGKTITGTLFSSAVLVSIIMAFIYGTNSNRSN